MKKIISLFLCIILVAGVVGCFAQGEDDGVKIMLNGEVKSLVAYNIKDNNYFKLRDIANLLKGTEAQFDVIWNESKNAIELISGVPYSTDEAMTSETIKNPVAKSSYVKIFKDGAEIILGAYDIADNNYFKLRDIASAIDFGVDWNEAEELIEINTGKSYEFPKSSEFGLNTQYLSLIGKKKAYADKMFGTGEYWPEYGMTDYDNGIMLGWNSIGGTPTDEHTAVTMYISLENLFFGCPDVLTADMIKSQFNTWYEGYNEMDEERTLGVNYCGKLITFTTEYALTRNSYAFVNVFNNYFNPNIETIQVKNSDEKPAEPAAPAENPTAYYDYAVAHDSEFWSINQDWRDDRNYYYLVDVDHDGKKEMVVKIGCGVGIYKETGGEVKQVYYNSLPNSSGSTNYWVARYNNKDYIVYTSASSSEYRSLCKLAGGELSDEKISMIINFTEYQINEKFVSEAEYYNYVNAIEYLDGMGIEGLK